MDLMELLLNDTLPTPLLLRSGSLGSQAKNSRFGECDFFLFWILFFDGASKKNPGVAWGGGMPFNLNGD